LLITPGVLTDALGFALLVPPIRRRMRRYLAERFKTRIAVHPMPGFGASPGGPDDVIDVEHHPSDD
jgi:UPF0716 protein FxsA